MYVSPSNEHWYAAVREGDRTVPLLGPYPTHAEAAAAVDPAWRMMTRAHPGFFAHFGTYGVARVVVEVPPRAHFALPDPAVLPAGCAITQ